MRRARLHVRRITARGVRVTALAKHQRGTFGAIDVEHFADEDQMIATFVLECGTALEARRATAHQRRVTTSAVALAAGQFVDAPRRNTYANGPLVRCHHVTTPIFGGATNSRGDRLGS